MDVRLINPFIAATERTFSIMGKCDLNTLAPIASRAIGFRKDFANAVVWMSGGIDGVVVMRFPFKMLVELVCLFDPGVETAQQAFDGIGEIANIVTGEAKRKITSRIVDITVPEILTDSTRVAELRALSPWLIVPFETPMGRFDLATSFVVRSENWADDTVVMT